MNALVPNTVQNTHTIMRIVFSGLGTRDMLDILYVCPDRYQVVFKDNYTLKNKPGPLFSKHALKLYIPERMLQGVYENYSESFTSIWIYIGTQSIDIEEIWDLENSIYCQIEELDLENINDLKRLSDRLDKWLGIFEETFSKTV